jgi:hypothetical protein
MEYASQLKIVKGSVGRPPIAPKIGNKIAGAPAGDNEPADSHRLAVERLRDLIGNAVQQQLIEHAFPCAPVAE